MSVSSIFSSIIIRKLVILLLTFPASFVVEAGNARLLSVPDVHGDIDLMKEAVALLGEIQSNDKLVFTGDFVDRGPKPKECYDYLQELADKHNVTRLTGNHEWITLMGVNQWHNFAQYVSPEDLQSFGGWAERQESFSAEGKYGKLIRQTFDVVTRENIASDPELSQTVFVHAGMKPSTLQSYGSIEAMKEAGKEMLKTDKLDTALLNEILQTRRLAQGKPKQICKEVKQILRIAKAERIVLGHTPTALIGAKEGEPLIKCGGRLILNDVAMSKWMGGGKPAAFIMETDDYGKVNRIYIKHSRGKEEDIPILPLLKDEDKHQEL